MISLRYENGAFVINAPYNAGFVAALKNAIPGNERRFHPDTKAWSVHERHGQILPILIEQYYNQHVSLPQVVKRIVTRSLDVRYIGRCKERDSGEILASGYFAGDEYPSIYFPEKVLLAWFGLGDEDSPLKAEKPANLYQELGVKQTASGAELKAAWRKLALHNHPDHNKEPDAHEVFIRIKNAYDILSNPDSRARYDAGLKLEKFVTVQVKREKRVADRYGYRTPVRCGIITVECSEILGKIHVSKILDWQDIRNAQGQILVTNWTGGLNGHITENWY